MRNRLWRDVIRCVASPAIPEASTNTCKCHRCMLHCSSSPLKPFPANPLPPPSQKKKKQQLEHCKVHLLYAVSYEETLTLPAMHRRLQYELMATFCISFDTFIFRTSTHCRLLCRSPLPLRLSMLRQPLPGRGSPSFSGLLCYPPLRAVSLQARGTLSHRRQVHSMYRPPEKKKREVKAIDVAIATSLRIPQIRQKRQRTV